MYFLHEMIAKLSCQSNHNQSRVDFHPFHMVLYQFQQAGNEEFQSRKKIGKKNSKLPDAGCRMQGKVANGTVVAGSSIGEQ